MKHSNERILTTHTGSLPRTDALTELLIAREQRRDFDAADMAREARVALDIVLQKQIDAGIDILNPVQISSANMEPEHLMESFGGKIVFWGGGCDTQQILPRGTAEEIREHVRCNLEIFNAKDGGYVFTQVHNIQQNVPPENVEAMFAAAREFG